MSRDEEVDEDDGGSGFNTEERRHGEQTYRRAQQAGVAGLRNVR